MANILYLHVGHPKTATTHLQEDIYPLFNHMHVRTKPICTNVFRNTKTIKGFHSDVIDLAFRRSPEVWDGLGDQILDAAIGNSRIPGQDVLLSSEGVLSCNTPAMALSHYKPFLKAVRRAGFKEVRVIYGIRRQDEAFGSGYAQRSDFNPNASQSDFEKAVLDTIDPATNFYLYNHGNYLAFPAGARYDYYEQHQALTSVFDDILTLPVELLSDDPRSYYDLLLEFVRAPELIREKLLRKLENRSATGIDGRSNKRSTRDATWAIQPRNPWFSLRLRRGILARWTCLPERLSIRPLELARPCHITMPHQLRTAVLCRYQTSNRKLAEVTGLDLCRYGYILGDTPNS